MKNPSMLIMVKKIYENDKMKVQDIANHIEMMSFSKFIHSSMIFFEEYGSPIHSKFKSESKMIEQFEKFNYGITIPSDITKWCIRFELNREEMILNSMKLETIINIIRYKFPHIFVVHTSENSKKIIIRCYIRNFMLRGIINVTEQNIIDIMKNIQETIIRGYKDITSASVVKIVKSSVKPNGEIDTNKIYAIDTNGTNLESILENPYIDIYRTQTDSITEFEEMFGIEATRNKIIAEIVKAMPDTSKDHCTIFADEMTYSGKVTSIQKTGLQIREMSNVSLRLSFQSPIQVIENAATDSLVDKISGISGPLIVGMSPSIGTSYNAVLVNEDFIKDNVKNLSQKIEDEL